MHATKLLRITASGGLVWLLACGEAEAPPRAAEVRPEVALPVSGAQETKRPRAQLTARALDTYESIGSYLEEVSAEIDKADQPDQREMLNQVERLAELHEALGEQIAELDDVPNEAWDEFASELRTVLTQIERQAQRVRALLGPTSA